MRIAAIAAEYNPFHNGHEYLINRVRLSGVSHVVAVMSGNFTQRGEPAVMSKRLRAEAALKCGADLVVELPLVNAVSSAQGFARGAAAVIRALGCIDVVTFGAETDRLDILRSAADAIGRGDVSRLCGELLGGGINYPAARQEAVARICGADTADVLSTPNNILAVEYIKALGDDVEYLPVLRHGDGHDENYSGGSFACAGEIRRAMLVGGDISETVPTGSLEILRRAVKNGETLSPARFETAVLSRLRMMTAGEFADLPDVSEGLHNRLRAAANDATTLEEFYAIAKTKRYTHSRIRRIALCALLHIGKREAQTPPAYIRVLGLNERGREILRRCRPSLPVIMKSSQIRAAGDGAVAEFELDCRAADQYNLFINAPKRCGEEYTANAVLLTR